MPVAFLFVLTQVMNLIHATDTNKLKSHTPEEVRSIDFMMENVLQHFKKQNRKLPQFKRKLLVPSVAQIVGNYLDPPSAQKMAMTDTQWSKMKVYEMLIPNQCPTVKFFQHLETGSVVYDDPFLGLPRFQPTKAKLDEIFNSSASRGNALFEWFGRYGNKNISDMPENSLRFLNLYRKKLIYLIAEDVDVNMRNQGEFKNFYPTPLVLATLYSADEAIRKLLERGADVSGGANVGEKSVLHLAVAKECESSCEILLLFNADVNAENRWGDTPLDSAVFRNLPNIVKLLLNESTDVERSTVDKALSIAEGVHTVPGLSKTKHLACADIIIQYKNNAPKRKRNQKNENQE